MRVRINNEAEFIDDFLSIIYSDQWWGERDKDRLSIFTFPTKYPCVAVSYEEDWDDDGDYGGMQTDKITKHYFSFNFLVD